MWPVLTCHPMRCGTHVLRLLLLIGLALAGTLSVTPPTHAQPAAESLKPAQDARPGEWLNIQGIGWDGSTDAGPQFRLAHGIGYRYLYHGQKHDLYEGPHRRDLFFYYNDPHKHIQPTVEHSLTAQQIEQAAALAPYTMARFPSLPRAIDQRELQKLQRQAPEVFATLKEKFEATKSWAHVDRPFPDNLAQLQIWGDADANRWEPCPDYQQRAVIDEHVAAIVEHVGAQQRPDRGYLFKGIVIDVPELWKEFNWASNRPLPGVPDEARSGRVHGEIRHDFATLQEGWYHFLAQLREGLVQAYPDRGVKMIYEPSNLWNDWGRHVADIRYDSVTPDMLGAIRGDAMVSEKPTLDFLTDENLRDAGWDLSQLGNVTGDLFPKNPSYQLQLVVLGEIAARGSHFFAYGTFARQFDRQPHTYSPDLLMLRPVAGWENMHPTPLDQRLWDYENRVYLSPTAVADEHGLAAVNPNDGTVQGAARGPGARFQLAPGVEVESIRPVNAFFEDTDGPPPLRLEGDTLVPAEGVELPAGFRMTVRRPDPDAAVFSHPDAGRLVHRPQDEPVILRELHNPGFELGGEGWYTGDGGQVRVVPATDRVRSGQRSGKLVDRTKAWHGFGQRIADVLNVKGPGTYRLSAFAQPETGQTQARIELKVQTPGSDETYESSPVEIHAGRWTRVSAQFEVAFDQPVAVGNLSIRIDHPTLAFYLDDVTLEKLD